MRGSADVRRWRLEALERLKLSFERGDYRFADAIDRSERVVVPKAQNRIALRQKKSVALLIVRALRVLASVDFDNQPRLSASEVGEIRPDRRLSYKFGVNQTAIAQAMPKPALGFGWDGAKLLRAGSRWKVFGAHR
jgi:hypothetical protein